MRNLNPVLVHLIDGKHCAYTTKKTFVAKIVIVTYLTMLT